MRVVSIVGARPQFIKVAPISWKSRGLCDHLIVHTGQHYDLELSENFFTELEIPPPVKNFYSGSGSHGNQTARILVAAEEALLELKPDCVLVYGDTNSTLAATLAAAKLGIKIGHIEAGLRSFNRFMPEEINRIGTDHLSDLLFAPTEAAHRNLEHEGLKNRSFLVGDVMLETLLRMKERVLENNVAVSETLFATIHRAENTDQRERLSEIIERLSSSTVPVKLYAHPRLVRMAHEFQIKLQVGAISLCTPASYHATIKGILESIGVVTDSGGLQKEAYLLGRPCLTVRAETEWIETLAGSWNQLDPMLSKIGERWWDVERPAINFSLYGDGKASSKILDTLLER